MGDEVMKQLFGEWLKARRRSLGMGLSRCAGRAGIGSEGLRLIETGKSCPAGCKVSTLYGLACVLRLDVMEILERAIQEDAHLMAWLARSWDD